ncbi:imidazole glycerol phosphate synthase subunit HisH [Actinobacteria bacterium IMCC26103]|nr:imidazole glycerol phosphate synthase subunit HisH [Actinobacteria bacterium IMCC26103]
MIAILDYGSGNLRSAQRAFERSGSEVVVTSDRDVALNASGLVVPGVGAFAACMRGLIAIGGDKIVRERVAAKRPTLGICVGMQILFRDGDEYATDQLHQGVGIWKESITKLAAPILPHMGWNTVEVTGPSQLFKGIEDQAFYFVHSYAAKAKVGLSQAWTSYGAKFLSAVEDGAICATQFHPEKSGDAGLALIKNWVGML